MIMWDIEEEMVRWLGMDAVRCDVLNVVRNIDLRKVTMPEILHCSNIRDLREKE